MHEIVGDLWQENAEGAAVAITTNGVANKVGQAIMLLGCERQARDRFPNLLQTLGSLIRQHGNHVFDLGHQIVSFPIEEDPYQVPEMGLIDQSCRELVDLAGYKGWQKIVVPRPGCGAGGLAWQEAKMIQVRRFDEGFHVITVEK